jgi:drug/metabolite transporter (DMT)-like permease
MQVGVWLGSVLGLTSAACWACANIAIQSSARRFGSWGALVWAQLIGGVVGVGVALAVEGMPTLDRRALVPIAIAGVAACVAYAGLFESLRRGQVAIVTPMISAWAVIAVGIAVGFQGATLGSAGALGVAAVVAGNTLLARSGAGSEGQTPPAAVAWALAAACGFGVMVPSIEVAGRLVGRLWTVPLVWTVELLIGLPALRLLRALGPRPRGARDWFIVSRAALFEVGGFIALTLALGFAPVAVVGPLSSLSTAFAVALGLAMLRERIPPKALAGATLACVGVLLVNL